MEERTYCVKAEKGATVLQVLEDIFRRHEATLAFRYSCRIGLCGTCSVVVNGKPGLACLRQAEAGADGVMTIEPMPRGTTIVDLAKDLR